MSAYYLIDAHTALLADSEINDVIDSRTDILSSGNHAAVVNGNFVVRIADNQRLAADPTSLNDLLTQKYNGLKERYGFDNVLYDSLLDATSVSGTSYRGGERGAVGPINNPLYTAMQVASTTASRVYVALEFFRWRYINPKNGRLLRVYEEQPDTGCALSMNNGSTYLSVNSSGIVSIPVSDQGTQVILAIGNSSYTNPLLLGSWAVLY